MPLTAPSRRVSLVRAQKVDPATISPAQDQLPLLAGHRPKEMCACALRTSNRDGNT